MQILLIGLGWILGGWVWSILTGIDDY